VEHPSRAAGTAPSDDRFDRAVAGLTEDQRQAVFTPSEALCIVAGAGSGKTRVLTLRVARRIRDGSAEADHTVVCTFTRKAAFELRHRLSLFGTAVSAPAPAGGVPSPGVRAGTLHQLGLTLLRRHAQDAGDPPPVLTEHRFRTISSLAGDPGQASSIETEIAWAKARCLSPEAYVAAAQSSGRTVPAGLDRTATVFAAYQEGLRRRRCLDLDDVLVHSADLLHADAAFAETVHWRYRHLSIDEFQDVNPAQFRLIAALLGGRRDLCVVGDPNQAIYGWNGADPHLLTELPTLVPGMETVRLDENHRSSPQVVAAASAALGPAPTPPPRSVAADGPMAVVTAYDSDVAEAEGVAALLQARVEDGAAWSDQAVLARTHDQLATVGRALSKVGVPYRIAPGPEGAEGAIHGAPKPDGSGSRTRRGSGGGGDEGAVELATFHRAKGLEWASVHVVGLEEGLVPIVFAESHEARAEERRLLYVALTRPSVELHCSWAKRRRMANGRDMERQPSPWLAAVARVSRAGSGRLAPRDAGRLIAEIRARLER
jgi:DNA helicase II / ATP-dependent DNA helicase PcrA